MTNALANISEARRLLASTTDLSEVKAIRDKAEAVRKYRQVSGESMKAQNHAAEIRLMAERRAGELLTVMEKSQGGRPTKTSSTVSVVSLADMGVSHKQSSRWQTLARVPEHLFAARIEELQAAEKEVTTKEFLKMAVRQPATTEKQSVEQPQGVVASLDELSGQKFGTIYADPPWQYGNQATRASTDNHYDTMTVANIAAMPVASLVADDAHLHLWTTNGFLFEAKEIIEAWGFTYKSCFVWVKTQMGIGNYWRVSHEFLLLGVRGSAPFAAKDEKSWGEYRRGKHSAKPEEIRHSIERCSPGPRLEIFGRSPVEGWMVMGNQVERRLIPK